MAKPKKRKLEDAQHATATPTRQSSADDETQVVGRDVTVAKNDLDMLVSLIDGVLADLKNSKSYVDKWLEETGISEEDLDAVMRRIGKAIGRDFGIL